MLAVDNCLMLAVLGLSGGELILVLGAILILFGAKKIPEFMEGLRRGGVEFRKAVKEMDEEATDAGRSLGGIYGKPAGQAITAENQVAELYDPAVFHRRSDRPTKLQAIRELSNRLWRWARRLSCHLRRHR